MYFVQATYEHIDSGYKYLFELDAEDALTAESRIESYMIKKYDLKLNSDYECLQLCLNGKDEYGQPYGEFFDTARDQYTLIKL